MNNWQIKKLGEICNKVTKGGTPTTYGYSFTESGVNFLKIENISDGRVNLKSIRNFISEEAHMFQKKSILEVNDLLFSIAGTIGEICLIKEEYLPANTNQALAILRGYDKFLTPPFLTYQLNSSISQYVKSKARGGAMNNISLEDLKNVDLVIPPLETQQAIVSKIEELFSELDKGIEDLKTAQQQLKTYRQSVLKWAFEGKLTNLSAVKADENVKEGELPKGWERKTLKELTQKVEKVKRKEVDEKEELIYLDIGGLDNYFNKIENYKTYKWKDAPSRAQQIVKINDVLFSTVRTYMKNIAIVDKEIFNNQIASSGFTVLRANEQTNFKYIFYNTISDIFLNPLNELQTGSSYPAVRDSDVFSQKISIPKSLEEQNLIVQEIESRLSVADKMEESIAQSLLQAEALRQSILKRAFAGELVEL